MHYTEIEMAERTVCLLQGRFLQEIQFAGCVVVLMRVTICFEYSERPAYLMTLYSKVYKTCVRKFLRTIRGQQCYVGVAFHS